MKITSMKISNILSYEFLSDFDTAPNTINFNGDLNILIGANGSGKSNLIEIINKLFHQHFFEIYSIDDQALHLAITTNDYRDKIIKKNATTHINHDNKPIENTLFKNINYASEESLIQIELLPDIEDIGNMLRIQNNFEKLKKFSNKYCVNQDFFENNSMTTKEDIEKVTSASITFRFRVQYEKHLKFSLINHSSLLGEVFFYYYLEYFNQLQLLFKLINSNEGGDWTLLKTPFTLISSTRRYDSFQNYLHVGSSINSQLLGVELHERNSSTRIYTDINYIFHLTTIQIGQLYRDLLYDHGAKKVLESINNSDNVLTKINTALKKNLNIEIKLNTINRQPDTILLEIFEGDKRIEFSTLSMGQKSIFYLLFHIYKYETKNGLLVIDEPELHMHTSMQKKYFEILHRACEQSNIQIIIATHSSTFIDENTINSTFRFSKRDNHTSIVNPIVNNTQKELIQILTYTNSSRIFFSDHVILVEGDSDEYFFSVFFEDFIQRNNITDIDVEILYIGGKGNFTKWRNFLNIFEINSYFICDYDNIKDFGIVKDSFTRSKIDELYSQNIFILKDGDLEDYLGISKSKKGLESVISFCQNDLDTWKTKETSQSKLNELESIFIKILSN
ncbi:MAG: AAA family ATPase [Ignavibacteriae bacterium]|nr:AAA family ATPase [Ignavibacteriota bacterium]